MHEILVKISKILAYIKHITLLHIHYIKVHHLVAQTDSVMFEHAYMQHAVTARRRWSFHFSHVLINNTGCSIWTLSCKYCYDDRVRICIHIWTWIYGMQSDATVCRSPTYICNVNRGPGQSSWIQHRRDSSSIAKMQTSRIHHPRTTSFHKSPSMRQQDSLIISRRPIDPTIGAGHHIASCTI